ncbi:MAG TPA: glycoside hydrolase family 31 protein, partial [Clostridia bacterium]|nr:glycoside hydrolase family 31 protein [Clostridia bacterium]
MNYASHLLNKNEVIINEDDGAKLRIIFYKDNIARISRTLDKFAPKNDYIVIAEPEPVAFDVLEDKKSLTVTSGVLKLVISKRDMRISFYHGDSLLVGQPRYGMQLFQTTITVPRYESDLDNYPNMKHVSTDELPGYKFWLRFDFAPDEHVFGLGSNETGAFDRKARAQYLYQQNYKAPVPFFVSDKGYGVLVDTGAFSSFSYDFFGQTFYTDSVQMGDFYFIAGGNLDNVVRGYRLLTGQAPLMPKWFYGYTQCKEHYHTQKELLDVLHEYRRRKVPLDLIVQDWYYWPEGTWSDKSFDLSRYPDPKGMCDEVHSQNAKIMISVWPKTSGGASHRELWKKGQLLGDGEVYNVFDEGACETFWSQIMSMAKYGFDAWWCDCTEPYEDGWGTMVEDDELKTQMVGDYKKFIDSRYINLFSLLNSRNLYAKNRRDIPNKRMVNLTRSGYAGQQRCSTVVWSGDISASWTDLRNQVAEGLNFCASGLPYWTLDIGGFFPKAGFNGLRVNMRC